MAKIERTEFGHYYVKDPVVGKVCWRIPDAHPHDRVRYGIQLNAIGDELQRLCDDLDAGGPRRERVLRREGKAR